MQDWQAEDYIFDDLIGPPPPPPGVAISGRETRSARRPGRGRRRSAPVRPRRTQHGRIGCAMVAALCAISGVLATLLMITTPGSTRIASVMAASTGEPLIGVGGSTVVSTPTTPARSFLTPTPTMILPPNPALPVFCENTAAGTPTPIACTHCPWFTRTETATRRQVVADIDDAANSYGVPAYLARGISWDESGGWHEYVVSCSDDIGLFQLKWSYWQGLDLQEMPDCQLPVTADDVWTYGGNAHLGAKLLSFIICHYVYRGSVPGATRASPAPGTLAWYYQQAHRTLPDTTNPDGSPNPQSLCAAKYDDPALSYFKRLSVSPDIWSCPFTAKAGDATLLDVVISTYNQGVGTTDANGIQNWRYVHAIESVIASLPSE